ERAHPAENGRYLAGISVGKPAARDQVNGHGKVTGGNRVADGLIGRSMQAMPGACLFVQGGHEIGLDSHELAAQPLGKQVVVPEPLPGVIERDYEQVFTLEDVQNPHRVGRPGDGVAERGAEPAEDGGPRQELTYLAWLAAEHLLGQEVDHEPVVT